MKLFRLSLIISASVMPSVFSAHAENVFSAESGERAHYKIEASVNATCYSDEQGTDVVFNLKLLNTQAASCVVTVWDADGFANAKECQVTNYFLNGFKGNDCTVTMLSTRLPNFKVTCTHFDHKPFELSGSYPCK